MNSQQKLLFSDIQRNCTELSSARGKDYYAKGRVLNLTIIDKGALFVQLSATVRGNDIIPYKQNIRITWRSDYSSATIDGNCSCPIGYNCKHVAAVCLMYQFHQQNQPNNSVNTRCLDWLQKLNDLPSKTDSEQEFIAYLLNHPVNDPDEFILEVRITKFKRSSGFNKGRTVSISELLYPRYESYYQEADSDIIHLVHALNRGYMNFNTCRLSGSIGFLIIERLLQTGRFFWQDCQGKPLIAGEKRDLTFNWKLNQEGNYQLLTEIIPEASLMFTDPPQYLDLATGEIGGFSSEQLTLKQLKLYVSAPPVAEIYAEEFSRRLLLEYSDSLLPVPKPVSITEMEQLPVVPKLRLFAVQLNTTSYQHFVELCFNYGEWTCSAKTKSEYQVVNSKQGLLRIHRNTQAEQSALKRLFNCGLVVSSFDISNELLLTCPHELDWGYFLQYELPELEQAGWIIEQDGSFRLKFQSANGWNADIEDSQNDWFEMGFTIDVNGQSYPLLPLIMPVLENYALAHLPETLHLSLGNYHYVTVASEQLKPILAILLELFNNSLLTRNGVLRLSRFNVASLAELEKHQYGLFSLSGGKRLRELAQKLVNFEGIESVALPTNLQAELRPYQKQGLNWLQFLREYQFGGILADDMGLGKTIQTLAHLLVEKQSGRMKLPCLIVAPTSLMSNWRRETERFTPDLSVLTLQGTERKHFFDKIKDYDLVLTTYPLLPRDEEVLLKQRYHYLILDEAQTVKNPTAIAAQLVRKIKTKHRLCLTGTPMENHLGELWAQFDFLMPNFLGDSSRFKKNYRTPIESLGDAERKAQLTQRIAPFVLRRTKQAVATELPAKTEIIRTVALHPKQATLYESIRLTMEQRVRDAIEERGLARSRITILDALLKLRQTCCDPRTLSLKTAQKIKESAKLDLLMDILPEQLEEGRRILIFSQFTRMIALIEAELNAQQITYAKLTGQTKKRDDAIALFKSGAVNVFLISLKAGGVGLNLTEADTVIIYDPWWNPAAEDQAMDRAHRIGQDKPVFVYKLVTENTVEEKILAMQERKRVLANSIYTEGAKEESLNLTADDLTALFEPLTL